jgi:hypothetical protein
MTTENELQLENRMKVLEQKRDSSKRSKRQIVWGVIISFLGFPWLFFPSETVSPSSNITDECRFAIAAGLKSSSACYSSSTSAGGTERPMFAFGVCLLIIAFFVFWAAKTNHIPEESLEKTEREIAAITKLIQDDIEIVDDSVADQRGNNPDGSKDA